MSTLTLRQEAIELLERLAGVESDPGGRGYAQGMASRLRSDSRAAVSQKYVDGLVAEVARLEAEAAERQPALARREAQRLLEEAKGRVDRVLNLDGLEQGYLTDTLLAINQTIADAERALEEHGCWR